MNIHSDIHDEIRFLAKSEIRLKILSELYERPENVRGLVKKTKITYSSVSSNVIKLEKSKYITKINNKYYVTPMAELYFGTLLEFKSSTDLISNFKAFWEKHDIQRLNIDSIQNITDLKYCEMIETTPVDIYKTHNAIKDQLINSKTTKAIFPYLHPEYPIIIEKILENNGTVELIIPEIISKEIMSPIDEKIKRNAMLRGKLKVYIANNDLNIYLTVSDRNMSLGLFKDDGSFDQNRILVSNNVNSSNWAKKLFNHIKGQVI